MSVSPQPGHHWIFVNQDLIVINRYSLIFFPSQGKSPICNVGGWVRVVPQNPQNKMGKDHTYVCEKS